MSELVHLIYSSTPFGFDQSDLNGILLSAGRNNPRDDVSGALVCRHDVYLQYLEGPSDMVNALFGRIVRDDRHVEVTQRSKGPIDTRIFGDWAMLHDPAQSLIWSIDEVAKGAMDHSNAASYLTIFNDIAAKTRAA